MKLAFTSGTSKPPEETIVADQKNSRRYSIWSDIEAMKFLEQTRRDIHNIEKKARRTRLLVVLSSLAGGILFILCFGVLSVIYTEQQLFKQQLPQNPEKISNVGILPNNFNRVREI